MKVGKKKNRGTGKNCFDTNQKFKNKKQTGLKKRKTGRQKKIKQNNFSFSSFQKTIESKEHTHPHTHSAGSSSSDV